MATWLAALARARLASALLGALAVLGLPPGLTGAAEAGASSIAQGDGGAQEGRTVAPPADVLDPRSLRAVTLDLLGRSPYRAEHERWRGRGLREYLDEVLGSEEFWREWLEEQLWYFFLIDDFRPETERVRAIPAALAEGRLHVRDAIHRIALSPSFELRNPGADTFVTVVLEQLLGVTVQKSSRELEIGKTIYDGGRGLFLGDTGETQADVVSIAIGDKGFERHLLEREHARLLRREAPRRELAAWARELRRDPWSYTDVLREWVLSDAYRERLADRRLLPNRVFVRALFVDLLDRLPEPAEVEPLRNALDGLSDSAPLRSIVARLLLDSGTVPAPERAALADRAGWITGLFERLYGRAPSPAELAAFTGALGEPTCRPETVLYALVSHPEYHHY